MRVRSSAVALVVILAVCCFGMYVAVTGFFNSRGPSVSPLLGRPNAVSTLLVVTVPTNTLTVAKGTAPAVVVPVATPPDSILPPIGAAQTIPAPPPGDVARPPATLTITLKPPTLAPTLGSNQATSPAPSCSGFAFCPTGGPSDPQLAPTGEACPRNYIWGRIVDLGRRGIKDMRVRFKLPTGNYDTVISKGPPDPPGIYNILAPPPGGSWTLWLVDAGGVAQSPPFTLIAPQVYLGSGNCPNRVDFVQQR